jgi:DNA invertase Pin-like site-specific DNA recombinase
MRRPAGRRKVRRAIGQKGPSGPLLQSVQTGTSRVFGYARVSTEEQNLDVQITALKGAGAHELFVEKISAVVAKRPMFDLMMKSVEAGDTVLFHSLSRMGRELPQLLRILGELGRQGVAWRSLTEPHLDNTTSSGRLMLNITGAMAQFERDQIVDRTKRGMAERKRQGMWLGRKPKVSPADVRTMAALRRRRVEVEVIARRFKVKPSTVYARTNALKRAKQKKA